MLPRKNRFQTRTEKDFFKDCLVVKLKTLKYYFKPTQDEIQIAIRVTKRTAKTAVKRHALKRKLTGFFEKKIKIKTSFGQLLIITNKDLSSFDWSDTTKDLELLWSSSCCSPLAPPRRGARMTKEGNPGITTRLVAK